MIELFEWIEAGFALTLIATIAALFLVPLVLVIDCTIGRLLAARYRCLLWTLVAVRLLMPYGPASALSLQNLWQLATFQAEPQIVQEIAPALPEANPEPSAIPALIAKPLEPILVAAVDWQGILFGGLSLVWFAGLLVVIVRAVMASAKFERRLRSIQCVDETILIDLLRRVCDQVGVQRLPQLKYVPELQSPALFGILRPILCFPEEVRGQLTSSEIRLIMLHEVIHLRRRDGASSWLLTVLHAVHWFNPMAWLARNRIVTYREMACDEGVRHFSTPGEHMTYTDLLVRFAVGYGPANLSLLGLWFASPVRRISDRIDAFRSHEKTRRVVSRLAVWTLLMLLAMVGWTDATTWATDDDSDQAISDAHWQKMPKSLLDPNAILVNFVDNSQDVVEERFYDISQALEKLDEFDSNVDNRRQLLAHLKSAYMGVESVNEVDGDPNKLRVVMSQRGHDFFTGVLKGLGKSGPWQVAIETRVFRGEDIEMLEGIDWTNAVRFALPTGREPTQRIAEANTQRKIDKADITASAEAEYWEYAPYLTFKISEKQFQAMVALQQRSGGQSSNAPKITVFNGQEAQVRDEAKRPFVVGVSYVRGELATAAQPEIAVLRDGVQLEVRPLVADDATLDLHCRLTVFSVDDVGVTKLPGQQVTVQTPRSSRRTISTDCQLRTGQALLIAPIAAKTQDHDSEFHCYAIKPTWFLPEKSLPNAPR